MGSYFSDPSGLGLEVRIKCWRVHCFQESTFNVAVHLDYTSSIIKCAATVTCPNLDRLGNGSVSMSSNFVGGRAYYRCNYGYQLSGYSSRSCQLSGEWSGTQPTCISECTSY